MWNLKIFKRDKPPEKNPQKVQTKKQLSRTSQEILARTHAKNTMVFYVDQNILS